MHAPTVVLSAVKHNNDPGGFAPADPPRLWRASDFVGSPFGECHKRHITIGLPIHRSGCANIFKRFILDVAF